MTKVSKVNISNAEIKEKIKVYKNDYEKVETVKNMIMRIVEKCENKDENTLI